ncbi:Thioredoxin-1 [Erysiphe neolycopersici]|uniref:Thioredoxin n=1 Tax=Erysiphe neolycopersici TaxID=212602 RepID=A0A420HQ65_9PEZI|nr:Thioredoxin-1 [Erysiphe neolycopersici]
MVVHEIKDKSKFDETIRNNKLVVVDAYATWCGPCRAVAPFIELLSTNHPHAHFVRFDVEKIPELAESLGIRAMPTFVFFKGAEKVQEVVGANSIEVERLVVDLA